MAPGPAAPRLLPLIALVAFAVGGVVAQAKEWPGKVPTAEERGRELYDRHCVACHGPSAAGDGPAADALVVPVPDLSQGLDARKRQEHVRVVMRGRGVMPGFDVAFRDLKPWNADVSVYARNVLDHMDRLAGRAEPVQAREEDPLDEDEDEVAGDAP